MIISTISIFFILLVISINLQGQTGRFFIGMGGFAKHSFPNGNANQELNILEYSDTKSVTNILDPGYEFIVGFRFTNRFDLLAGINSEIGHLYSSPYTYELNFQQINYPLRLRYHFGSSQTFSNFIMVGVNWGKILQRDLSRDRTTWEHSYLEDWNDISPFNMEFGIGRSFSVTEKSNLIVNPYLSYELSKNEILKGFFNPISLGIKISYEFNLK